jgi:hypothetical protein
MLPLREISVASVPTIPPSGLSRLQCKTMEEERLASLGKRKYTASPERPSKSTLKNRATPPSDLLNDREGCPYSWQLGESVDDFVARLPPLTTSAIWYEWIWASNPYHNSHGGSKWPRLDEFKPRGAQLLEDSLQNRHAIQAESRKLKGTIMQLLNEEAKLLHQRILTLATETNVLSGKVSKRNLLL